MKPTPRLAPKVLTLSFVAALGLLGACTESFDLTLTYTSDGVPTSSLSVDNIDGNVRLRKGPINAPVSGTVKIHAGGFDEKADAREGAQAVDVVETLSEDGAMVLRVVVPDAFRNKTFVVSLDLVVPDNVAVSVFTDNGRVDIDGLVVRELDTTFGEITLAFTRAPPDGMTEARTNDGRISVDSHEGELDVSTTNAPLELFSVSGSTRGATTQGEIRARLLPPRRGDVFLATTNAPIDLALPRQFGAQLVASTTAPGAVFIDGLQFTPTGSFPNQAQGVLGDGEGRVDVRTVGADIAVHD